MIVYYCLCMNSNQYEEKTIPGLDSIFLFSNFFCSNKFFWCRYPKLLLVEIAVLSLFLQEAPGMKGGQHLETFWQRSMKHPDFLYCPIRCSCFSCINFLFLGHIIFSSISHVLLISTWLFPCQSSKVLNLQSVLLGFQMM